MIDYSKVAVGDILRVTLEHGSNDSFAMPGDLVRILETHSESVIVENRNREKAEFIFNCGAKRLEETEWKGDLQLEGL